jgi:hypothetical protein
MNVLRGTFRLSILAAVVTLLVAMWLAWAEANDEAYKTYDLWKTLKCGHETLKGNYDPHKDAAGMIDLGKVGCAQRKFLSWPLEIEDAAKEKNPLDEARWQGFGWRKTIAYQKAVAAFVFVNLLGLAFLGLRRAYRWVRAGYSS